MSRLLWPTSAQARKVVIENDTRPVAILRPAEASPGRLLLGSIALAEAHASTVTLGRDLELIISSLRDSLETTNYWL
ncbi:MAG TPA: hypothetical protein VIY69_16710 [Candidatus Acidoferrales bacterium]